ALLWIGLRRRHGISSVSTNAYWLIFALSVIVLGVGVHGGRETGGLAHICLQPLVLLGLALLASQWDLLGRAWQRAIIAGVTVDAVAGIILQFAVENHALDRWLAA